MSTTTQHRMTDHVIPASHRRRDAPMLRFTTAALLLGVSAATLILAAVSPPAQEAAAQVGQCVRQLCLGVEGNGDYISQQDITDATPTQWCGTYRVTVTRAATGATETVGEARVCKGAGHPTAAFATYAWYRDGDVLCADARPDPGYPTRSGRPCVEVPL
jgi:hypothetical protein